MSKKLRLLNEIISDLLKIRLPHRKNFSRTERKDLENKILPQIGEKQLWPERIYWELTTARNRNLISFDEQNRLRNTTVAFFGLSVGYHGVISWELLSRADKIIIADPDTVSATNLNRLPFSWKELGKLKVSVTREQIMKINPYSQVVCQEAVDKESIMALFKNKPPDLIVDEIDDLAGKSLLREMARKYHLPLISATDVGDNVSLDVERYDQKPYPQPFLGRVLEIEKIDFSKLDPIARRKLIFKIVGFEENSDRMLGSLMAIGGSIPTWPQLGSTATIAGGIVAATIKKIILGENVGSGRYYFSLDSILDSKFNSAEQKSARKGKIDSINYLMKKDEND